MPMDRAAPLHVLYGCFFLAFLPEGSYQNRPPYPMTQSLAMCVCVCAEDERDTHTREYSEN